MGNQLSRHGLGPAAATRVAGAGLLACAAYLIGTQIVLEPSAYASSSTDKCSVVVNNLTPPTVVLSANERAIVGAADGAFYVVDYDGNAVEVRTERAARRDEHALLWR